MAVEENRWSDWYYVDGGDEEHSVRKMLDNAHQQDYRINQEWWYQAEIDTRFKVGNQAIYNEYFANMPSHRRRSFFFNRILRATNMICGRQRQNRKAIVAVPVEEQDQEQSDEITAAIAHVAAYNDSYEILSQAFESGAVTTGFGLMQVWMDYTRDPESGDPMLDNVPFNGVMIDPYFKKKDLSDCRYIWRRKWYSNQQAAQMLPERANEIMNMRPNGNRDGRFQYMAEVYQYDQNNLLTYDEYWYRCTRETTFLVDTETRQVKEWRGDDDGLEEFLKSFPQIAARKAIVPTVKLAVAVDGHPMYHGPNPLELDVYPFVGVFGYFEPSLPYIGDRMQGVVRNLRDAQFLYNRRKVIELDILESQINSGMKYKVDALVNPQDIFLVGQGKHLAMKGSSDMNDVQQLVPPPFNTAMLQISESLGREIMEISGVNEELLGSADDDKAGILAQLRQGAGLTTLQGLFDSFDNSTKQLGKIYSEIIQRNFSFGKMQSILGREPSPVYRLKPEDRYFSQYDIRIEEGFDTATQRQMQMAQLLQLREIGVPVPSGVLVQAATLQNKNDLVQAIQAEEQAQSQAQQMEMQKQMALLQAQIENMEAKSLADTGLGIERASRLQENQLLAEERRTQAIENIEAAKLDKVRAIKEIEQMDLAKIQQLLALVQLMGQSVDEKAESITPGLGAQPAAALGQNMPQM